MKEVLASLVQGKICFSRRSGILILPRPGEEQPVAWYNPALTGGSGEITDLLDPGTITTAVRGRKRPEKASGQREEHYRTLFENVPMGLYRMAPDGKLLAVNKAFMKLQKYSSFEELAGLVLEREGYSSPRYSHQELVKKLEKDGGIWRIETERKNGTESFITVCEHVTAIRDETGKIKYYDGFIEDITDRKQMEDELEKVREKIIEKNKLAAGVAHELNTPLANIDLAVEYLLNLSENDPSALDSGHLRGELRDIKEDCRICTRLVKDLLYFS